MVVHVFMCACIAEEKTQEISDFHRVWLNICWFCFVFFFWLFLLFVITTKKLSVLSAIPDIPPIFRFSPSLWFLSILFYIYFFPFFFLISNIQLWFVRNTVTSDYKSLWMTWLFIQLSGNFLLITNGNVVWNGDFVDWQICVFNVAFSLSWFTLWACVCVYLYSNFAF